MEPELDTEDADELGALLGGVMPVACENTPVRGGVESVVSGSLIAALCRGELGSKFMFCIVGLIPVVEFVGRMRRRGRVGVHGGLDAEAAILPGDETAGVAEEGPTLCVLEDRICGACVDAFV